MGRSSEDYLDSLLRQAMGIEEPKPVQAAETVIANVISEEIPVEMPVEMPTDMPTDIPIDETPAGIPGEEVFTDIPMDIPTDISTDIPTDIPMDIPMDTPADIPIAETPADEVLMDIPTDMLQEEASIEKPLIEEPSIEESLIEEPAMEELPIEELQKEEPLMEMPSIEEPQPEDIPMDIPMDVPADISMDALIDVPSDSENISIDIPSDSEDIPVDIHEDISELTLEMLENDTADEDTGDQLPTEAEDAVPEEKIIMPDDPSLVDEEINELLDSIGELDAAFGPLKDEPEEETTNEEASSEPAPTEELTSDFGGLDLGEVDLSAMLDDVTSSLDEEQNEAASLSSDDSDLGLLLDSIGENNSELSEIGDLLGKDENSEIVDPTSETAEALFAADVENDAFDIDNLLGEEEPSEKETKEERKRRKKEEKEAKKAAKKEKAENGFLARLFAVFGDDDEEENAESAENKEGDTVFEASATDIAVEGAAENEAIINEMEDAEKEDKKKKKKDKKKDKKNKKEAEGDGEDGESEAPKKKKKEKKKKEDKAPEAPLKKLPKKKIIVIAVFCVSLAAIMIFLAYFFPYSQDMSKAKKYYVTGDYQKTYEYLRGHKMSDKDKDLYNKSVILLKVQRQVDSYRNYMKMGMRVEALNALVQGVDAMDTYAELADSLGVASEFSMICNTLVNDLNMTFGVEVDKAREWLRIEGSKEYTRALYEYLGESPAQSGMVEEGSQAPADIQIIVQEENEDNLDS